MSDHTTRNVTSGFCNTHKPSMLGGLKGGPALVAVGPKALALTTSCLSPLSVSVYVSIPGHVSNLPGT